MKNLKKLQLALIAFVLVAANLSSYAPKADAATLTKATVMEYNMAAGSSAVAVAFTAASTGVPGTVSVNFGSWGGTIVAGSTPVTSTGCTSIFTAAGSPFTSITALPGTLTASGASNTLSISGATSITSGTAYCAIFTGSPVTTNPTAGVYPVTLTSGSDTATSAIDVISGDTISVSATVAPSFTLSLSGSSDTLGTLSSNNYVASTGVTATVSTNAPSGWYVWAADSNAGIRSTAQSKTISSVATGSNASLTCSYPCAEKYALGVTTGNALANYADAGGSTGGGLTTSATGFNPIAVGNTSTASSTVTMKELASISPTTPAATDYADTITVVGAGSF